MNFKVRRKMAVIDQKRQFNIKRFFIKVNKACVKLCKLFVSFLL